MTEVNFFVTTLLNGIWEGALLAVAMWLFLKFVPRLNPTTRFTVLWATLLATLALLVGPFMSRQTTRGAGSTSTRVTDETTLLAPTKPEDPSFSTQNQVSNSPLRPLVVPKPTQAPKSDSTSKIQLGASQLVEAATTPTRSAPMIAAVQYPLIRIRSGRMLMGFETLWAAVTLLMLMRLGFGYWKLRGLKISALPICRE